MTRTNAATLLALALIIPGTILCASWAEAQLSGAKSELSAMAAPVGSAQEPDWVASAPGRVEPKGGEIKIGAAMNGRIAKVLVKENELVARGDVLVDLEDEGMTARFESAKVEAARAKKDRDDAGGGDSDYRVSEDDVANAELAFWNARDELDRASSKQRNGDGTPTELEDARKSYVTAGNLLANKRDALVDLQARKKRPNPNRQESALAAARSEQAIAAALVEKSHIRAPINGTVLKVDAKPGEIVAPTPELILVTVGDMSNLRVKAEVDEHDIGRIKLGQGAIVRVDAFQGQDFTGHVSLIAPTLTAPELGGIGAARRTDIDVLQIYVDLDPKSPLIPGLRVDVFFKPATGNDTGAAAPQASGGVLPQASGAAAPANAVAPAAPAPATTAPTGAPSAAAGNGVTAGGKPKTP